MHNIHVQAKRNVNNNNNNNSTTETTIWQHT